MDRANLPTNANASSCKCGNALPHTHTREFFNGADAGTPGAGVRARAAREARAAGQRPQRPLPNRPMPAPTPGQAGGSMLGNSCHFPAPAPRRIYCAPAPFTAPLGGTNQLLVTAYGYSKPVDPVGMPQRRWR